MPKTSGQRELRESVPPVSKVWCPSSLIRNVRPVKLALFILLFGAVLAVTLKAWPKMRRTAKVFIGLGLAGVLAVVAFVFLAFSPAREESAKHLARVDWLPIEARDVTYAKSDGFGWFTCYECSLPKEALDRMAQNEGWKLEPKIDVHTGLRMILGLPALKKTEYGEIDLVARAMFFEKRQPNGGGITVIYDLDAGRLFVHESHR